MALAVATFVVFPVGFIAYVTITVRGVVGAGSTNLGKKLRVIPEDFEPDQLVFSTYLPSRDDVSKQAMQATGDLAADDFSAEATSTFQKKIKATLVASGNLDVLRMQGYWEASTDSAQRMLSLYGTMFDKMTRMGYLLMCLELVKKLLQTVLLVVLDEDTVELQLLALQCLTALQIGLVLKTAAYNERLRNIVEPVVLLTQLFTFLVPLLLVLDALEDKTASATMMVTATTGIGIALLKEMSQSVPATLSKFKSLLSSSSGSKLSAARRDFSGKLLQANKLNPGVLKFATSALDDETVALMQKSTETLAVAMKSYAGGASKSLERWLEETGDELIRQAKEHGVLEQVQPPVALFHRDGLTEAAENGLKKELLDLKATRMLNTGGP